MFWQYVYTISMRTTYRMLDWKLVFGNYVGGIGYYLFHFGWILLAFFVLSHVLQFVILGSDPLQYTPPQTVAEQSRALHSGSISWFAEATIVAMYCLMCALLLTLPYWAGYLSRSLPRIVLRHTTWKATNRSLFLVKLTGCAAVAVASIFILYTPGATAADNLGFLLVLGAAGVAVCCFWVQYIVVTLWKIPERRVF